VRDALATLPWVEQKSIVTDIATKEVQFRLADKSKFNLDEVKKALEAQNFQAIKLKSGPT
jgi:hypothetical protein